MKLNLDSFMEDSFTYFRLYISCPVCMTNGKPTEPSFWFHYDNKCHGDIYIGDNAFCKCKKCGHSAGLGCCTFACPSHGGVSFSTTYHGITAHDTSIVAQLVETTGIPWLKRCLSNMSKEGK